MNKKYIIAVVILIVMLIIGLIFSLKYINANFEKHIKLLEIKSQNWELVDASSDYFYGKYYEIYRDGYVYTYDIYNKSGKKNEKNFEISIENISKIENLLKSVIDKPEDYSASDGTGWTFKYFDKEGNVLKEYTGYIYKYRVFNEILDLLKE